jgi:hypothetical protein
MDNKTFTVQASHTIITHTCDNIFMVQATDIVILLRVGVG